MWQREFGHEPVDFLDLRLSGLLDPGGQLSPATRHATEFDRLLTPLARELDAEKRQEHE